MNSANNKQANKHKTIVCQLVISVRNKRTKQSGRAKTERERRVYVRTHVLACVHSVTRLCVFALEQMLDFSMLDFP